MTASAASAVWRVSHVILPRSGRVGLSGPGRASPKTRFVLVLSKAVPVFSSLTPPTARGPCYFSFGQAHGYA